MKPGQIDNGRFLTNIERLTCLTHAGEAVDLTSALMRRLTWSTPTMRLFHSFTSPFARKVLVVAHELGVRSALSLRTVVTSPINQNPELVASNPLGQLPALCLDDGRVIADSRVIVEYLDQTFGGRLFARDGATRWEVLGDQSLGDGMIGVALSMRYETALRPSEFAWSTWNEAKTKKIESSFKAMDSRIVSIGSAVDVGTISWACGLSYLDFRFPRLDWRSQAASLGLWYENFAQRPSMVATALRNQP
jgi:glutathione S-transferase